MAIVELGRVLKTLVQTVDGGFLDSSRVAEDEQKLAKALEPLKDTPVPDEGNVRAHRERFLTTGEVLREQTTTNSHPTPKGKSGTTLFPAITTPRS